MTVCESKGCERLPMHNKRLCKVCKSAYNRGYTVGYNTMKNRVYNEILEHIGVEKNG